VNPSLSYNGQINKEIVLEAKRHSYQTIDNRKQAQPQKQQYPVEQQRHSRKASPYLNLAKSAE